MSARPFAPPLRAATATSTWRDRAACLDTTEPLWDGDHADNGTKDTRARAKKECRRCPVLAQCLAEQMRIEGPVMDSRGTAVIGGLTAKERTRTYVAGAVFGPYDAEEARLLALEAEATGVPVRSIAGDAGESTVRLALRLLGKRVSDVDIGARSTLKQALEHAEEIRRGRAGGIAIKQLATELGTSRETMRQAVHALEDTDHGGLAVAS